MEVERKLAPRACLRDPAAAVASTTESACRGGGGVCTTAS